jgi:hypothetical protein
VGHYLCTGKLPIDLLNARLPEGFANLYRGISVLAFRFFCVRVPPQQGDLRRAHHASGASPIRVVL